MTHTQCYLNIYNKDIQIHCGSSLRNVLKPELTGLRRPFYPVYEAP